MWLHKRWETRPERRPALPVWRPTEGPDTAQQARDEPDGLTA